MSCALIRNYNNRVSPNDTVLWLGDCFFLSRTVQNIILSSLNGIKYLVRGNHDKRYSDDFLKRIGFTEVYSKYIEMEIDSIPVYCSHYPFSGYSADKRFEALRPPTDRVIVHGHTHDKCKLTSKNTVHVGVDAWDYGPTSYSEVSELVKQAHKVICGQ
jgi:calcineurin-like phosphoesterase family protein